MNKNRTVLVNVQGLSLFMNDVPTCKRHITPNLSPTSVSEKLLREQVPGKTCIYGLHRKIGTCKPIDHLVNSLRQAPSTSTKPNLSNTTSDLVLSK